METVYIDNYGKIFCEMRRNGMVTAMASRVQEIEFLSDGTKATYEAGKENWTQQNESVSEDLMSWGH